MMAVWFICLKTIEGVVFDFQREDYIFFADSSRNGLKKESEKERGGKCLQTKYGKQRVEYRTVL